jgi:hypothetical protein
MIALNNPGNIRYNPAYKGCTGQNKGFCTFSSIGYGYRAILVTITTYYTKYGLKTIRGIISRYAPPTENNTEHYIAEVSRYSGFSPNENLTEENLIKLLPGIVKMENSISTTVPEVQAMINSAGTGNIALSALSVILALYFGYIWLR